MRGHTCIFGRVQSAACFVDDAVESLDRRNTSGPLLGKSSASVVPGLGNDSMPSEGVLPNSFSTARNEPLPLRAISASRASTPSREVAGGSTHWYCRKPEGPYMRFQSRMPSSG